MRMNYVRRTAALALAVFLATGVLSGCKGKNREPDTAVAKGRYMEHELSLPEELDDSNLYSFIKGKDGRLELFIRMPSEQDALQDNRRYVYDGENWQHDETWEGDRMLKEHKVNLVNVAYGMDGNYYLGGWDESYIFHLYRMEENGTVTELLEDVFKPEPDKSYGMMPVKCEALSDGRIVLHYYNETYLYRPDGTRELVMPKDFSGSVNDAPGFVTDEEYVTVLNGNVVRYSLEDGQVTETIACDSVKNNVTGILTLFGDGTGGIYAANETGLSHISKGGTLWETLIDGSLNTMSMRSVIMNNFIGGDNKDYYGAYTGQFGPGIQIFHYSYDPDMVSVPPTTLNVYALEDNSTIRQAAALFQKDHPEVRVEFRAALNQGEDITEDIIKSLNTELLSGKGADVLILDGLPIDAYKEKGILLDMRDVFSEIQKESPVSENILKGFTEEDGSVYEMPARISIPVLLDPDGVKEAYASLDSMKSFKGEKPLTGVDTYANLLRLVANIQYLELFPEGIAEIPEATLVNYLETVMALGEQSGAKEEFTKQEEEILGTNNETVPKGIRGDAVAYDMGKTAGATEILNSLQSMAFPIAVMEKHPELSLSSLKELYFPSSIVGINQATEQSDTAKAFVKYVFSTPVQEVGFYDGFPVQKEALDVLVNMENENLSMMASWGDGYSIIGTWPSKDKRELVLGMIPSLETPVDIDERVMGMIISESKDYFEGKATASQAASAIGQKLKLYFAE